MDTSSHDSSYHHNHPRSHTCIVISTPSTLLAESSSTAETLTPSIQALPPGHVYTSRRKILGLSLSLLSTRDRSMRCSRTARPCRPGADCPCRVHLRAALAKAIATPTRDRRNAYSSTTTKRQCCIRTGSAIGHDDDKALWKCDTKAGPCDR